MPAPSRMPGGSSQVLPPCARPAAWKASTSAGGGRGGGKADGAAIGEGRHLAVDRLRRREGAGLGAPEDAMTIDMPWLDAQRTQQRVVERLGFVEIVGPDHDVRK